MAGKRSKGILFGSVATGISRGIQLTAEQLGRCLTERDTGYRYLALADIKEGFSFETNTDNLRFFDPSVLGRDVEQFCIKPDMILLTKNDTPFKVQITGNIGDRKIIVGGNVYLISVDEEKAIPRWLCYWLQSDEGMAQLRSAASLTNNGKMKWISIKQLESIIIPELTFEQQAEYLCKKLDEYNKWFEKISQEFARNTEEILAILKALGIEVNNKENGQNK